MRAMGPGSVSSFLKIILDVVYYALIVVLGALVLITIGGLLLSFNPELLKNIDMSGDRGEITAKGPMLVAVLVYALLSVGALLAIVRYLRMVFATLTAGDPFHPDNIKRLRLVGFVLAGMEIGRYAFQAVLTAIAPDADRTLDGVSPTTWFAVLVVFVLAEVFREGARLRREAELTI